MRTYSAMLESNTNATKRILPSELMAAVHTETVMAQVVMVAARAMEVMEEDTVDTVDTGARHRRQHFRALRILLAWECLDLRVQVQITLLSGNNILPKTPKHIITTSSRPYNSNSLYMGHRMSSHHHLHHQVALLKQATTRCHLHRVCKDRSTLDADSAWQARELPRMRQGVPERT